jgi:hypothetical protein
LFPQATNPGTACSISCTHIPRITYPHCTTEIGGRGASKKGAAINNLQIITNRTEESGSLCAAKRRNKSDATPIQSHRFTRTCPKQNRSPGNHTTTHQIEGRSGRESREIPVPGFRVRARNRFEVDEMGAAEAAACERKSCGCVCLRVGGRRWQPGTRERAQGKGSVKRGKFETAVRGGLYRASVVVAPPFSSLMCRAHRPLG